MALLQALLALIGRSFSRILDAILGWAVVALFGKTAPTQKTLLTGIVAAAAVWPLLFAGIAFPHIAAFALAFVPATKSVPSWILRIVWIALAIGVPLLVGSVIAARSPPGVVRESRAKRLLRGYPITIGIGVAFVILAVTIPALRLASLVRRHKDEHLPLLTDAAEYDEAAARIDLIVDAYRLGALRIMPPWWLTFPSRVLLFLGGDAVASFIPRHLAYWRGPSLELALYSSDLLIRGTTKRTSFAHAIVTENFGRGPGLSTYGAVAQELERQLHQLWGVLLEDAVHHEGSRRLAQRLDEVVRDLARADVDWEDWQVLYRKALQFGRALSGDDQILENHAERDTAMQPQREPHLANPPAVHGASTGELMTELIRQSGELIKAEMALARAEAKADIKREVKMAASFGIGFAFVLWTVDLLLVTAVLALANVLPAWAAALIVAGGALVVAVAASAYAYMKRVNKPLERTQKTLTENVRWAKERLA